MRESARPGMLAVLALNNSGLGRAWAIVLVTALMLRHYLLPQIDTFVSGVVVFSAVTAIVTILSSISSEAASQRVKHDSISGKIMNVIGYVFFVASIIPFSAPWVVAYYFPRETLYFFAAWALAGALLAELSVLVSHQVSMHGGEGPLESKKVTFVEKNQKGNVLRKVESFAHISNLPSGSKEDKQMLKRRRRKSTGPQAAGQQIYGSYERRELERFLVSEEGVRWWASFLAMQLIFVVTATFLGLVQEFVMLPMLENMRVNGELVMPQSGEVSLIHGLLNIPAWRVLFGSTAIGLLTLAMVGNGFWLTYAVGGRWLHFQKQWKFFQPMRGGKRFRSMQAVCWSLFFIYLLLSLKEVHLPIRVSLELFAKNPEVVVLVDRWHGYVTGVLATFFLDDLPAGSAPLIGIFAELFLLVSLPLYKERVDRSGQQLARLSEQEEDMLDDVLDDIVLDPNNPTAASLGIDAALLRPLPKRSEFNVPMWALVGDILRTACFSPIVIALVKPEGSLFLIGFAMIHYLQGWKPLEDYPAVHGECACVRLRIPCNICFVPFLFFLISGVLKLILDFSTISHDCLYPGLHPHLHWQTSKNWL